MRISYYCFAILMAIGTIFSSQCIAKDANIYLDPEMVFIDARGIHIAYYGNLYAVNHLSSDIQGIYVSTTSVADESFFIHFPDGHPNLPWNLVCSLCGTNLY